MTKHIGWPHIGCSQKWTESPVQNIKNTQSWIYVRGLAACKVQFPKHKECLKICSTLLVI